MKKYLIAFISSTIALAVIFLWLGKTSQAEARQSGELLSFTLVVNLPSVESPEVAIDTQMALVELLEYLRQRGGLTTFTPYYGTNQIVIQGSQAIRTYLAGFPGLTVLDGWPASTPAAAFPLADGINSPSLDGTITGIITDTETTLPIAGIKVTAWYFDGTLYTPYKNVTTGASGIYELTGLPPSSNYKVQFEDPQGGYVKQYYQGKLGLSDADKVAVNSGQITANINAAMQPSGNISGMVRKLLNDQPIKDIVVNAYTLVSGEWRLVKFAVTNASGIYTLTGLPVGNIRVRFSDPSLVPVYVTEYFPNHDLIALASDVPVTTRNTTTSIDVQLGGWATITGAVTGQGSTPTISGIQVDVWGEVLTQWTHEISGTATTAANGNYTSNFLGTRDYRLRFSDPFGMYLTKYYTNGLTLDAAARVPVNLGNNTPNINIQLNLNPSAPITQTFGTGWYLVGWPVDLVPPDPATVFAPITDTLGVVYDYDACQQTPTWTSYNPDQPPELNTLTELARTEGYWVRHAGAQSLRVEGQYSVTTNITLCTGWNLIGYPAARPRPVKEVLDDTVYGIKGNYTLVYGYDGNDLADPWEKFDPAFSSGNDLTTLQPGRAYWVLMKSNDTLTIPAR